MTKIFQHIDTVFVPSKDIDKAFKWYEEVLGGTPGWRSENGEYQSLKFGQTALTLFQTNEDKYFEPRRAAYNFYVPSAQEAYDHLRKHDVKVEEIAEYDVKYFAFYDLDGNRLEVCEY